MDQQRTRSGTDRPDRADLDHLDRDSGLVVAAADGSEQAWSALVERHLPAVWSWSLAATSGRAEAEAVSRLVWLRLAQALPALEHASLLDWLQRAVEDEAARVHRRPLRGPTRRVRAQDRVPSARSGQDPTGRG